MGRINRLTLQPLMTAHSLASLKIRKGTGTLSSRFTVQYGTLFFSLSLQYFSKIIMACSIVALITAEYFSAHYLKHDLAHWFNIYVLFETFLKIWMKLIGQTEMVMWTKIRLTQHI